VTVPATTTKPEPTWLTGFFTGMVHAVTNLDHRTAFHGLILVWSVCGVPTVLHEQPIESRRVCPTCMRQLGQYPP
jgi:hypothetical protein